MTQFQWKKAWLLLLTFGVAACGNNVKPYSNDRTTAKEPPVSAQIGEFGFDSVKSSKCGEAQPTANLFPSNPWNQEQFHQNEFIACAGNSGENGLFLFEESPLSEEARAVCLVPASRKISTLSGPGVLTDGFLYQVQLDSNGLPLHQCQFIDPLVGTKFDFDQEVFAADFAFNSAYVVEAHLLSEMLSCLGVAGQPTSPLECPNYAYGSFAP